jgi:hypothetical protein
MAAGVLRLAMLAGAQTGAGGGKAKADMLQPQKPGAEKAEEGGDEGGGEGRVYVILALLLLSDLFGSACEPLCDAICMSALADAALYPSVRLWGSIGALLVFAPLMIPSQDSAGAPGPTFSGVACVGRILRNKATSKQRSLALEIQDA